VVFVNRWSKPDREIQLTWVQIVVAGLLSLVTMPLEGPRLAFSPVLLWAIVITAVFATALGIWAQLRFQPRISPAAAAVIYASEPVFAGLAAWLMLGTVPTSGTLLGAGFIVAGMVLTSTTPAEIKPHLP
jgi:drug/metabolite transporter (DMT)-like permease